MTPLIDATEMYLRTIWELEEEGITPIRARLVERLGLSAPAVSETVAKLEAEGLLHVADDRTLTLSKDGRGIALSVMRKHRLAELLLTEVIGMEWEQVHTEACRWEHVISDEVEERLIELLNRPTTCPHGNPIPGLASAEAEPLPTMAQAAKKKGNVVLRRISERLQGDVAGMRFLRDAGLAPGVSVTISTAGSDILAALDGREVRVPRDVADLVYVSQ